MERVLSVQPRTKNERSTGLRAVRRNNRPLTMVDSQERLSFACSFYTVLQNMLTVEKMGAWAVKNTRLTSAPDTAL